jgi:SAM-dependent methyltransferase
MHVMSWTTVWAARRLGAGRPLTQLMAADGFDGMAAVEEAAWVEYIAHVRARLGITAPASVFEVGCGAGAFLYPLYQSGFRVGGLDGSAALVDYARAAMPDGDFARAEAVTLSGEPWDFVVSNGVFPYFPSLDYAAAVLARMHRKARRGLAILDVPDPARREEALAMRRAAPGAGEDEAWYHGLDHLYIDRGWLSSNLERLGCADITVEDQTMRSYAHAPYRFNVFATL